MFVSWSELKNNIPTIFIHLILHLNDLIQLWILAFFFGGEILALSSLSRARGFNDSIYGESCLLLRHRFLLPLKIPNTDERFRWKQWWRRFLVIGYVETHNWLCIGFRIFYTIWSFFCGVLNSYPKRYKLKNSKSRAPSTQALLMNGSCWNLVWKDWDSKEHD